MNCTGTLKIHNVPLLNLISNPKKQPRKASIAEVLARLDGQEKKEIEAIDHALSIMETGQYGFCEVCGKPIAKKRLDAIPWTVFCSKHAP